MIKLQQGDIYIYEDGVLVPYDIMSHKYKGYTLPKLYDLYLDRKSIVKKLHDYRDKLIKENYHLSGNTLYEVIDNIINDETLKIINSKDNYYLFELEEGYIKKTHYGNGVGKYEIPKDIDMGYYYVEGNKIIKDDKREEEMIWITL